MNSICFYLLICFLSVPLVVRQTNDCGELKINAPNYFDPWDVGSLKASFGTGKSAIVDWTLVTENYRTKRVEVESILQKTSVEPKLWNSNDSGIVTAIATATTEGGCSITTAVHVLVIERAGSPLIIDEYGKVSRNEERGRLDVAVAEMNKRPKHNFLVYLDFRFTDPPAVRRLRMTQIFDHVISLRKFDAKRLLFLISTTDRTYVKLQAASGVETETIPSIYPESLVVRADQLAEYKKLFQ